MSDDGQKRRVIRQTTVYDKTRPEGEQKVAFLWAQEGHIFFGCQRARVENEPNAGISVLGKQHAIEFASCLLMMALGLPGAIPDGDVSFGPEQFGEQDEEEAP